MVGGNRFALLNCAHRFPDEPQTRLSSNLLELEWIIFLFPTFPLLSRLCCTSCPVYV
jgi:hypothetical protein